MPLLFRKSFHFMVLASVAAVLGLLLAVGPHQSGTAALAQSAAPQRPGTRSVNWRVGRSSRVPSSVFTTIRRFVGGGGDRGLCSSEYAIMVPGDQPYFVMLPRDEVFLGRPHANGDIHVFACNNENSVYTATLAGPAGIAATSAFSASGYFDLTPDSPSGNYVLSIEGPSVALTHTLVVTRYDGLHLRLIDPLTGQDTVPVRGQDIRVDYLGFRAGDQIDVGLYFDPPDYQGPADGYEYPEMIATWDFTPTISGIYSESLSIPADARAGTYVLMACSLRDCALSFEGDPYGISSVISPPSLAWEAFELPAVPVVAYAKSSQGGSDLHIYDIENNRYFQLTNSRYDESEPAWDPLGDWIAYQSNQEGNYDIWIVDRSGQNPLQLTTWEHDEWEPNWSPSGDQIVYRVGGDRNGEGEIWVMNADGTDKHPLTNKRILGHAPAWSPDGKKLAFDAKSGGISQIYIYDVSTRQKRKLTDCDTHCRFPVWSPNGYDIAYHSIRSLTDQTPDAIWSIQVDGSETPTQLASGDTPGHPSWVSDIDGIVFSSEQGLETVQSNGDARTTILIMIPDSNDRYSGGYSPDAVTSYPLQSTEVITVEATSRISETHDTGLITDADYFTLSWVPECDPLRAEVALLYPGEEACDPGVKIWTLDMLVEALDNHILQDGERLLPVHLEGKANQRIGIFDRNGKQSGWLNLKERRLWRTDYGTDVQGPTDCQLRTDYSWDCAKG